MWTPETRAEHDRDDLRYPSDPLQPVLTADANGNPTFDTTRYLFPSLNQIGSENRTRGCVLMDHPGALAALARRCGFGRIHVKRLPGRRRADAHVAAYDDQLP